MAADDELLRVERASEPLPVGYRRGSRERQCAAPQAAIDIEYTNVVKNRLPGSQVSEQRFASLYVAATQDWGAGKQLDGLLGGFQPLFLVETGEMRSAGKLCARVPDGILTCVQTQPE